MSKSFRQILRNRQGIQSAHTKDALSHYTDQAKLALFDEVVAALRGMAEQFSFVMLDEDALNSDREAITSVRAILRRVDAITKESTK